MLSAYDVLSPIPDAASVLDKSHSKGTASDVFASVLGIRAANELALAKSEDEVSIDGGTAGHDFPDGSYERTCELVATPALRALPCPGNEYGDTVDGQYHYASIRGTYLDYVIAGCDACDRFWKVPYAVTDDEGRACVMVGTPEPRVRAYLAPDAAKDALNDPAFTPDEDDTLPDGTQSVITPDGTSSND